jgi:hypothetical protein
MNIEITKEAILTQLGYPVNEALLKQLESIIKNTVGFNKFAKHLISLNDHLKHMNAFVALSNSERYFKIKCSEDDSDEIKQEFSQKIVHWAKKYKVELKQLQNKNTYYIIGLKD